MEKEASKEDKDKCTEAEMEKSFVNNQDVKIGSEGTRSGSSQSQPKNDVPNTKQPKVSEAMIKDLEEQNFIKLVSKLKCPEKYGNNQFYCEVCNNLVEKMQDVKNHISGKGHRKNKKTKGPVLIMKRIDQPSPKHIEALETMLESVIQEYGLDPDKDLNVRLQVKDEIQEIVQSHISGSYLTLYGSSLTCFGFKTSDVNLDLTLPEEITVPQGLIKLFDILEKNDLCINVKDEFDLNVPQISFIHKKTGLTCHLSCGSKMVCKTSELLKKYGEINPVVRKLVVGFRFWAQCCCIDKTSDGGLAPYCFALMVIQFLQCTNPPILPRLNVQAEITGDQLKFKTSNTASLGLLWFKLFRYYCVEFEIDENAVSIRVKQPFCRETRRWGRRRFAIEDPYMTGHNVSTVSSDKVFDYIIHCMHTSFVYFGTPQKGIEKEANNRSVSEPISASQQRRSRQDSDEVEVYEEVSDEDSQNGKPGARKISSERKVQESNDDDIFQMDDLEDGEGVAVGGEGGATKTPSKEKEITTLEYKMKNLNVVGQRDASRNSITKTSLENPSKTSHTHLNNESSNNMGITKAGTKNQMQKQIIYGIKSEVLSGGRRPEVQCQVCKKDGHMSSRCPDLRKPTLKALPPLNSGVVDLVTNVCSRAKDLIAFLPEERKFRESVLWNLEEYIQEVFPDAQLHLFGSSMNGFGFKDSDLDICMTLEGKYKEEVDCINVINQLAKKLKQHRDCSNVIAITTAKVPIVKFYLRSVKREADISLYNVLALENTKLLATYAQLDERVAILGYTLKLFAKVCDIGDASKGSLSSYAYILMLLHFLQKRDPPVIPVLQELYAGDTQPRNMIEGWNCWFYNDLQNLSKVWKSNIRNTESVGSLWIGFLRYFTETFDWEHEVVCCRRSKKLTKFERMWTRHIFAIEDPFNLDHNLGAGITRKMGTFIRNALARGRERFGSTPPVLPFLILIDFYFHVDFLTDGCEAPSDRTCRVCGHIGHIARECPRLKKNRREERERLQDRSNLSNRPFAMMNASPRKRASTVPIQITRKDTVTEKKEDHLAESLPSDPFPKDAMRASKPPDGIEKPSSMPTGLDKAFLEKQQTKSIEAVASIQGDVLGANTSNEQSQHQVSQPSRSNLGPKPQVEDQFTRAPMDPLPRSSHTDTQNDSVTSHASNIPQDTPRPGFGPVGPSAFTNPSLPSKNVPYGVQLLPPEKFMSPPKGSIHTHPAGSPHQPFLSPQQHLGQLSDEARISNQILPGFPVIPLLENPLNAWTPMPHLEPHYHSPPARNIPGQPRERPRSVSESMASPDAHPEHRIPLSIGSSPPVHPEYRMPLPIGSSPSVPMPLGSPPQVFRSYNDNPFWGNRGFPTQNVGSPSRHPSSLPSNFPMPHPTRNVDQAHFLMQQQQQQPAQSPPQPQPMMPKAYGGNMSPDVFFKMVKEAEQQSTRQVQNSQDARPKPIPSSDAVLSHPVATPIFKPPKTADEKELFSKLDKVRGLWTGATPDNGLNYKTQTNSGNDYMKTMPSQEKENNFKKEVKGSSHNDLQEAYFVQEKQPREIRNDHVSIGSREQFDQVSMEPREQANTSLGITMDVSERTVNDITPDSKATNKQPQPPNPTEIKVDQPSTQILPQDRKSEKPSEGTASPVLKKQLEDEGKKKRNSKDKTKQKQQQQQQQQTSTDTSKLLKKKQGLLGDKPGESLASGKKRQENRPNKNMDATDSSSSTSLGAGSESETALFDLRSYQKAFPLGDLDMETNSDRDGGDGSVPQPKPHKKQNRNKSNARNGQESRNTASGSRVVEESSSSSRRGNKKGGFGDKGASSAGEPAPKRRKSKEGLPSGIRSSKEESKEKVGKSVENGSTVETTQKKEIETPSKNSRGPRENRNRRKQAKGPASEDKSESFEKVPVESSVAPTPQGKNGGTSASKTPNVPKEDKTRGRRKQSKDSPPAGKSTPSPSPENTTGTSSQVQMTPKKGEKSGTPSTTTRGTKEENVKVIEQGRGVTPVAKKESPTSRSEDSGEDTKGGNSGPKRKSKGRGRGRGRGRGYDTQPQPGPGTDAKTSRSGNEKHKGSQEPRK